MVFLLQHYKWEDLERANALTTHFLLWKTKIRLITVNNIVALWRLGARNILGLPLLAASSKMETAPMAGKT